MYTYELVKKCILAYANIINSAYGLIMELLSETGWFTDIVKSDTFSQPIAAIKATAITLCTLFFLIDFFTKTLHLQWVTWENVLMLFLKVIAAKICIDNCEEIVMAIYNGFSSIITSVNLPDTKLIPTSNSVSMGQCFFLTFDEASMLDEETGFLDFQPVWMMAKSGIAGSLLIIVMVVCNIIVIGRIFELVIYTILAPIPLSTLACDGLSDIGKGFLKSYAAVCVQAIVLMIVFIAYTQLCEFLNNTTLLNGVAMMRGLLNVFILAIGVMQSGTWAKRICGAM